MNFVETITEPDDGEIYFGTFGLVINHTPKTLGLVTQTPWKGGSQATITGPLRGCSPYFVSIVQQLNYESLREGQLSSQN